MSTQKKPEHELMQTALRIPKDKHREFKILAAQLDKSLQELYMGAIDHILKKYSRDR
jgi:hypothetical protein